MFNVNNSLKQIANRKTKSEVSEKEKKVQKHVLINGIIITVMLKEPN